MASDIKCGTEKIDESTVKSNIRDYFLDIHPYFFQINGDDVYKYLNLIKYGIPYHIFKVLQQHPEFVVPKLHKIMLVLYFLQNHYQFKNDLETLEKSGTKQKLISESNDNLKKIVSTFLNFCGPSAAIAEVQKVEPTKNSEKLATDFKALEAAKDEKKKQIEESLKDFLTIVEAKKTIINDKETEINKIPD